MANTREKAERNVSFLDDKDIQRYIIHFYVPRFIKFYFEKTSSRKKVSMSHMLKEMLFNVKYERFNKAACNQLDFYGGYDLAFTLNASQYKNIKRLAETVGVPVNQMVKQYIIYTFRTDSSICLEDKEDNKTYHYLKIEFERECREKELQKKNKSSGSTTKSSTKKYKYSKKEVYSLDKKGHTARTGLKDEECKKFFIACPTELKQSLDRIRNSFNKNHDKRLNMSEFLRLLLIKAINIDEFKVSDNFNGLKKKSSISLVLNKSQYDVVGPTTDKIRDSIVQAITIS